MILRCKYFISITCYLDYVSVFIFLLMDALNSPFRKMMQTHRLRCDVSLWPCCTRGAWADYFDFASGLRNRRPNYFLGNCQYHHYPRFGPGSEAVWRWLWPWKHKSLGFNAMTQCSIFGCPAPSIAPVATEIKPLFYIHVIGALFIRSEMTDNFAHCLYISVWVCLCVHISV